MAKRISVMLGMSETIRRAGTGAGSELGGLLGQALHELDQPLEVLAQPGLGLLRGLTLPGLDGVLEGGDRDPELPQQLARAVLRHACKISCAPRHGRRRRSALSRALSRRAGPHARACRDCDRPVGPPPRSARSPPSLP